MDRLNITRIVPNANGNFIRTSSDDRKYMQVEFQKPVQAGLLTNAKTRFRNVWEEGPNGSAGDPLFNQLKNQDKNEDGYFTKKLQVVGDIQTLEIETHYIPNEYGKHAHPETGETCNIAETYTSVVFEDENIKSLARNNRMVPKGEKAEETQQVAQESNKTLDEELV